MGMMKQLFILAQEQIQKGQIVTVDGRPYGLPEATEAVVSHLKDGDGSRYAVVVRLSRGITGQYKPEEILEVRHNAP